MGNEVDYIWQERKETFINPYNFIELEGICKKEINAIDDRKNNKFQKGKGESLLTGVINCSLITKTPLFIPNTSNVKIEKIKDLKELLEGYETGRIKER